MFLGDGDEDGAGWDVDDDLDLPPMSDLIAEGVLPGKPGALSPVVGLGLI